MISVKYTKPNGVFEVLLDSEPSSDMIVCKDETEAERSLYQEYMRAVYEIRNQYHQAVDKIRRVK
jgi:alpha-ketoglutarate-dependent taurine dioxygenase